MKLWIARNEGYEEEYLHDRYQHVTGELLICYDKPILEFDFQKKRRIWKCARVMHEAPSYIFPMIQEGTCVEFQHVCEGPKELYQIRLWCSDDNCEEFWFDKELTGILSSKKEAEKELAKYAGMTSEQIEKECDVISVRKNRPRIETFKIF